jgi:4-amino-4-deoxy-L-arabinose transferase-like glycosyltransferase
LKILSPDSASGTSRLEWKAIVPLLVAFIILAIAYSVTNPLHEATDELRHYRFVRTIATTGQLPVQGQELCRSQSHHPPLYYALGALATFWIDTGRDLCDTPPENPFWAYRYWEVGRDNKNQFLHGQDETFPWNGEALGVQILRGINILLGAAVVWLTWASGRVIWPDRPAIAIGAAALVAFNPMFLYMSGSINNDVIAAFSGSAILFACLYLLHDPGGLRLRWGLILGTLFGLALMSKSNLAVSIIFIELVISWAAWRKNQGWQWVIANLLIIAIAGLIAGWWFLRNLSLYGDLTGFSAVTELWGARDPTESFALAISELPYAWSTLWGRFGFGQIPLPHAIYNGLLILTGIGLTGAILGFFRSAARSVKVSLAFLALYVLLFFLVLFGYMLVSPAGPNGRFFFPALSALALLIFFGLVQWILEIRDGINKFRARNRNLKPAATKDGAVVGLTTLLVTLGMLGLSLVALLGYLSPAYAKPPSIGSNEAIPNEVNVRFDTLATLLGYELNTDMVKPGEPIDIDLYWRVDAKPPGDYLLFVHLTNEEGAIIAQRDTHPGLGNYPSSQWEPGQRFKDSIRLYLPETAYSPVNATLSIGLYDPLAFRLAVSAEDRTPLGDSFQLGEVEIVPQSGSYTNSQSQNFSDEIKLIGYEYDRLEASPGDTIKVDLHWEALADVMSDYTVQVRLLDGSSRIWAEADNRPVEGRSPTDSWTLGQIISDTHNLTIPKDTPDGTYLIDIALLNNETGTRQNIVAFDGHWIDSHLSLAPVTIHS